MRDSKSSVEQLTEGAAVIWVEITGMSGLEGKFRANSVSRLATIMTSEQSETALSDLPVLRELIKACTALLAAWTAAVLARSVAAWERTLYIDKVGLR